MDDAGNILIRRYAKSNIYIKSTSSNVNEETAIGAEILKLPNNALESEKIVKVIVIFVVVVAFSLPGKFGVYFKCTSNQCVFSARNVICSYSI